MSKLTETLKSQLPENLKNISITFDADLLDKNLTDKLSIYLSTNSATKLIELSFSIASTKRLGIDDRNIIEQIQHKPAKQLVQIISQKPKIDSKNLQQADIPRWMVLSLGSEIPMMNAKSLITTEDAINTIFRLCLDWLEKVIGNNGQAAKKVS